MKRIVIINLVLTKRWFDLIASGHKKAEYRAIKKHWNRVFGSRDSIKIKGKHYHPREVIICFSNGYQSDRRQVFVECEGLSVGVGLKTWGAPTERVYILKLGKILTHGQVEKLKKEIAIRQN